MAEHEYDVQRAKEDKDQLMHHYEQQIKKLSDELSLEKRETSKMRQLMHSTTPQKKIGHQDVSMLREELEKKSELIKTLAAKVTTPKKMDSDLEKRHEAELCKLKKGYEKLIEDYKKTNEELLRHVPASAAKKVMSIKRTVDDSEVEDENTAPELMDKSTVEATPVRERSEDTEKGRKRRHRKTKGKSAHISQSVFFF